MKAWLSPKEVGEIAGGFSAKVIRAEIVAGELPAIWIQSHGRQKKLGRYRVKREDAIAYAERMRAKRDVPRDTRGPEAPLDPIGPLG